MDKSLLKEDRARDDVLFPMNVHSFDRIGSQNIFTCHWHDEWEFLLLTRGRAQIQVDNEMIDMVEGEGMWVQSGELHGGHAVDEVGFAFTAVVFHANLLYGNRCDAVQTRYLEPVLRDGMPPWLLFQPDMPWQADLLRHIHELVRLFQEKPYAFEMGIKARLFDSFSLLLQHAPRRGKPRNNADTLRNERMKVILDHIRDHYAQHIRVQDLAQLTGLSEGHFCSFFRSMTGKTLIDYLNSYRVHQAADLLRTTDARVLDIAMEVGFDNVGYFIHRFRQYMETTPQGYRKTFRAATATDFMIQ